MFWKNLRILLTALHLENRGLGRESLRKPKETLRTKFNQDKSSITSEQAELGRYIVQTLNSTFFQMPE